MNNQKKFIKNAQKNARKIAQGLAPPLPPRRGQSARPNTAVKTALIQNSTPVRRVRGESQQFATQGARATLNGSSRPDITSERSSSGDHRIRVRHREFVQDLGGAIAFSVGGLSINPGQETLFPWLSLIAQCYESYRFRNLTFQYRTACATTIGGKVVMAVDWDAEDLTPGTKQQLLENRTKADGPSWMDIDMICDKIDLHKFSKDRYIRSASSIPDTDIKTYDVGIWWVGVQGMVNTNNIGELWVVYDVDLMTPATPELETTDIGSQATKVVANTAITKAAPFGTAPISTFVQESIFQNINPSTLVVNLGDYIMEFLQVGTGLVVPGMTTGGTVNTATLLSSVINALGTVMTTTWFVHANIAPLGARPSYLFDNSGSTTVTASTVRASSWDPGLN